MIEKNNPFDLKKDIDLIGLGNAIVDIIVNVDDKGLPKLPINIKTLTDKNIPKILDIAQRNKPKKQRK